MDQDCKSVCKEGKSLSDLNRPNKQVSVWLVKAWRIDQIELRCDCVSNTNYVEICDLSLSPDCGHDGSVTQLKMLTFFINW